MKGVTTEADRSGNDKSDRNADKGVERIDGEGLIALGAWLAKRHQRYVKLMQRVHKVIAAVIKAEKEEREKSSG